MKPDNGMSVHMQNVMPILLSVLTLIGFSWPCVSGSTLGAPLGVCGTFGVPYTNLPPPSIVTINFPANPFLQHFFLPADWSTRVPTNGWITSHLKDKFLNWMNGYHSRQSFIRIFTNHSNERLTAPNQCVNGSRVCLLFRYIQWSPLVRATDVRSKWM